MVVRVEQTFFAPGTLDEVPGNCVQATVASILEMSLDLVPHFILFDSVWGRALQMWLDEKGYDLYEVGPDAPGPLMAYGDSPRGDFQHSVVWQDGKLLVDPHPDQTGLVGEPHEYWRIQKL